MKPGLSHTRPAGWSGWQVRMLTILWVSLAALSCARAERYLTPHEARQVCFPTATHFEEITIRFTQEQRAAIEITSGTKVRTLGNHCHVARQGSNLLGVVVVDHVLGKHEIIDYAVALGGDGRVLQVEILEYRESHGMEVRGKKWRQQFRNKAPDSRLKINDDIYNISGATISCRNVTEGIKRVLAVGAVVLSPLLGLGTGMSN